MDITTIPTEQIIALTSLAETAVSHFNRSLSVAEAAYFLGINRRLVLDYAQGGLPHYRVGGKILFVLADLIKWRETFRKEYGVNIR